MRAMSRCVSLLLPLWLWGCGAVSLDEMKAPVIDVRVPPASTMDDREPWLHIELREGGTDCPDLSENTKAFFNDTPVPLTTAGHWNDSFLPGLSPSSCYSTLFTARGSSVPSNVGEEVSRVRLTEGDTTLHAEARGVCAPRRVTMLSPTGGVLRPGDTVELEWQPATDELFASTIITRAAGGVQELARVDNGTLQVEGNRLRFVMPALRGDIQGAAELFPGHSGLELYRPHVTRCEGFAECQFHCTCQYGCEVYPPALQVTLQPN
jgi:hypothetical protein